MDNDGQAMDFYGMYRGVRNATWSMLLRFGIDRLPVSIFDLTERMGVPVLTYREAAVMIRRLRLEDYCRHNAGFALNLKTRWFIFFDEQSESSSLHFTLAHELGHVFLGHRLYHERTFSPLREPDPRRRMLAARLERQADMFAARALSPACVLWGLSVRGAGNIARLCRLPPAVAQARAVRMEELYRRDVFLKSAEEQALFMQFSPYVSEHAGGALPDHCCRRLAEKRAQNTRKARIIEEV